MMAFWALRPAKPYTLLPGMQSVDYQAGEAAEEQTYYEYCYIEIKHCEAVSGKLSADSCC